MRISDWSSDVCSSDLGLLQVAQRQRADSVLAVDHLALLGHAQAAIDRTARRGHHRARGLATAAADRAAAAVEEHDAHARRPCQRGQLHLGELQRPARGHQARSEEHTSELQSLMRISYAVFCLKKTK